MKLSANLSFLFQDLAFADRFPAAAAAGFHGVEMMFPYGYPSDEIRKLLQNNDLQLVLFNAPPGDWNSGDRGLAALPGREEEFKESFLLAMAYAENLNCKKVHVMAGCVSEHLAIHDCYSTLGANLKWANEIATEKGVKLLLEALNPQDMPAYLYRTTQQVSSFIRKLDLTSIRLQLDFYHHLKLGGAIKSVIAENIDILEHCQIAGLPDRHEPTLDSMDYEKIFTQLKQNGYDGWVGLEYIPSGDTLSGLHWAKKWLNGEHG